MIQLLFILLCSAMVFGAPSKPAAPVSSDRPQYNFLFIIDTSVSMSQRKPAAINMVRQIIASGFHGQIEPGDSIDIWTYDTEYNLRAFPPQIWVPAENLRISATAGNFLEGHKFKGRTRFAPVAADLQTLVPHTKNLLTVILTDGEEPVSGVSLDLEINEFLAREKKLRPASLRPLLISLAATNGKFREWTVFNGEGDLRLAKLPVRPKAPPVIAEKKPKPEPAKEPEPPVVINFPPGTKITQAARTPPPPTPLWLGPPAPVFLGPPVPKEILALAQTNRTETTRKLAETPLIASVVPPKDPPAEPTPKTKEPPPTNAAIVQPSAKVQTNSALANAPLQQPPVVIAKTDSSKTPTPVPTRKASANFNVPPTPSMSLKRIISISVMAGFGCFVVGALLLFRKYRHPSPSIISRSLLQR